MRTLGIRSTLACLLALSGCRRASEVEPTHTPEPDPIETDDADAQACRTPQRFTNYEWVPDDARLTTSLQRHDPELADALALLADRSTDPEAQLPVSAALDFRNLGMGLNAIDMLLGELGLDPAEIVELQGPHGTLVWTWSTDCPLPVLAARMLERFGAQLRADIQRPGLRLSVASSLPPLLPFDLITLGEHRVAFTLLGYGEEIGVWLYDAEHGSDGGPGRQLEDTPDAPIRAVLNGEALLDPNSPGAAARTRVIRVTASEWTATDQSP